MNVKRITIEEDLKKAFHIRKAVFVEEQGIPIEDEFDEFDKLNSHFLQKKKALTTINKSIIVSVFILTL
jgi:predicted GNAT family N-acyltransferase